MSLLLAARMEMTSSETVIPGQYRFNSKNEVDAAVQSAVTLNSSSASLEIDLNVATANADQFFRWKVAEAPSECFFRFRWKADSVPLTDDPYSPVIYYSGFVNSDSSAGVPTEYGPFIQLVKNGANADLRIRISHKGGKEDTTIASFAYSTEHVFIIRTKFAGSFKYHEVKIDGTIQSSGWYQCSTWATAVDTHAFGQDTSGTTIGTKMYYAEVMCNDTNGSKNNKWPGDSLTWTSMVPDGAGSNLAYTAWTNTYTAADESPSTSDATYTTAISNKEGWTLSGTPTATNPVAVAYCIDWGAQRVGGGTSGTFGAKFLLYDSAEYATAEYTADYLCGTGTTEGTPAHGYGPKGNNIVFETQPTDSSAWTTAVLGSLEAGIESVTHSDASWRHQLWNMRCYYIDGAEGDTPTDPGTPNFRRAAQVV